MSQPNPGAVAPNELSFRAIVLAVVLAMVLAAANAYLGLFAGLTVATAIPAAVVSMGVLRLLGGGTILENNIVQTGASAGSSIAAGVIFTIPALIILGYWQDFKYLWVLAIAGLGGLLGVLFSVPLRRSMIVEQPLPFPEGKAAAEVLKAGDNPGPGLKILGFSAAIGAVLKAAAASGMKLIPDTAAGAGFFGKYLGYLGTNLSPALLGVLFSVPLRRSMIVEQPLPFPEGKAAAEVLKAGDNPGPGLKILGFSAAIGAVLKAAAASGMKLIPDTAAGADFFGKYLGYMGTNLSPALLGVGYIVGLNIGIVVVSGSILSWHIAIPIYHAFFMGSDPALAQSVAGAGAEDIAGAIWSAKIRYLGVGAMLIGGVWTLFSLRNSLLNGIKSGIAAARKGSGEVVADTERDLPMKWMLVSLVLFVIPLLILYQLIVQDWAVSIPMAIIMVVAGFLFVSVSAYLAGLVGSSNNPVSGITIATILFASVVLMLLLGRDSPIGAVAAIMIGAVVCCAAAVGGDNLQDLKAGYLVGATPWKQQLMLGIGAFSCALIMAPVLSILAQAYGIGAPTAEHPNPLSAPQATLMASVAKGMFGGELPWGIIAIGAVIGAAIIALDETLKARGSSFRVPVLAAAIGIYLPLELMVPIFLGGLLAHLVEKRQGIVGTHDETLRDRVHRPGVLFSAGLITGEALMGIAVGVAIYASQDREVMALPASFQQGEIVGLVVLAIVGWLLFRTGTRDRV